MKWISLGTLLSTLLLTAFELPFRSRRQSSRSLTVEWIMETTLPALAVLPATGTIVEGNDAAERLFAGQPLLELALEGLFPTEAESLAAALAAAQSQGAAQLRVHWEGRPLTLLLGRSRQESTPLAAMFIPTGTQTLLPAAPAEEPHPLPPLTVDPAWYRLHPNRAIQLLLDRARKQWPDCEVALLRRQGMDLVPLFQAGEPLAWGQFRLPTTALGRLLHDGEPIRVPEGDRLLCLHPLHLFGDKLPWGAVAAALPATLGEQADEIEPALGSLALTAGLTLTVARLQNRERELNGRADRLEALTDHLLGQSRRGLLLLSGEGRIDAINEVASRLLNWPVDDVSGRSLFALLDDLGALGQKLREALETWEGNEPVSGSGRLQRPGARPTEVSYLIEPVEGTTSTVALFLEDRDSVASITETEQSLGRFVVLGKMAAMIAHDLRNPLGSILLGLENLAEVLGEEHEEAPSIELLLKEGERVRRIIEDILASSRQPSLTIRLCSLRALMDQIHDTHQRQLGEKHIQVRRYYDPSLPMVEGDPVRLGQMLTNLINNAIEALPVGGQLELVLRPLTLEQMIARGLNPDIQERLQGGVEILIRDNGPGIPPNLREQIFEPLFTTKSNGTGLGLSIVRTIVEQHRGLIFLDSELNKGTTFQLFLPQLSISAYRTD